MGSSNNTFLLAMTMVALVLGMTSLLGEAAETTPACAQDLLPCANYLNNTAPPDATCCNAVKETIATQLPCLCNLFYTPGILENFGGNTTSALRIATACGESLDVGKCKAATGAASPQSPPASPGVVPGADNAGSGRIEWTGFSALLLFWASVMFY